MPRPRGVCPVCLGHFTVRNDGLIGGHGDPNGVGGWCAGAERPPAGIVENGRVKPVPKVEVTSTRH